MQTEELSRAIATGSTVPAHSHAVRPERMAEDLDKGVILFFDHRDRRWCALSSRTMHI